MGVVLALDIQQHLVDITQFMDKLKPDTKMLIATHKLHINKPLMFNRLIKLSLKVMAKSLHMEKLRNQFKNLHLSRLQYQKHPKVSHTVDLLATNSNMRKPTRHSLRAMFKVLHMEMYLRTS